MQCVRYFVFGVLKVIAEYLTFIVCGSVVFECFARLAGAEAPVQTPLVLFAVLFLIRKAKHVR